MDGQMYRWMGKWINGLMGGWINGWMDGWVEGVMNGQMISGWMAYLITVRKASLVNAESLH